MAILIDRLLILFMGSLLALAAAPIVALTYSSYYSQRWFGWPKSDFIEHPFWGVLAIFEAKNMLDKLMVAIPVVLTLLGGWWAYRHLIGMAAHP